VPKDPDDLESDPKVQQIVAALRADQAERQEARDELERTCLEHDPVNGREIAAGVWRRWNEEWFLEQVDDFEREFGAGTALEVVSMPPWIRSKLAKPTPGDSRKLTKEIVEEMTHKAGTEFALWAVGNNLDGAFGAGTAVAVVQRRLSVH
jgi:hypothetical protein